ncbi:hypothetical protein SNE40_015220 [Patella caerulea]|uniref:G-protein coupled receptors family 1 profile domain-containing protein n=1 Tax=Patella caerulea TaxID=87958 RepID=A0AAN8JF97_PATCE
MNDSCVDCPTYTFTALNACVLVIYILLMIFIVGGNILTIIAIVKTEVLRTVANVYVTLLAFSDIIAGLALPLQMVYEFPEGRHELDENKSLCLGRHVVFFFSISLSLCSIVVIAFDRAVFIGFPYVYNRIATCKQAVIVACICMIIAVVDGTVTLYDNNWQPYESCTVETVLSWRYQLYGQVIPIMICFFLAGACYGYIFYIAKKHQKSIMSVQKNAKVANDMQIIKVLFLIYGIFLLCWMPVILYIILVRFFEIPVLVLNITLPIAVLNSGMNFIIYAVKNKDYRKAFKEILHLDCTLKRTAKVTPQKTNDIATATSDNKMN